MPKYRYVAVGADGKQSGTIVAPSSISARYELASRMLKVKSVRERKKLSKIEITKKRAKPMEIANLSRQLSAFLKAGVPVLDALEAISVESDNAVVRSMIQEIADQLRAGAPFSEAVTSHAEQFPSYYPGIIRSAELSGQLDLVLDQLADYIDRDLQTRRKVKSALTYPMVLAVMATVTVVVLVGFVLPKFQVFFEGFGKKLPVTTRILLDFGGIVSSWFLVIGGGMLLYALSVFLFLRTETGKRTRDRLLLRIPVVKGVVRAAVVERFCRILGAMVHAGIPIAGAMTAAIDSTDNRVFSRGLVQASEGMLQGEGLAAPIADTKLFPGTVTQMMRVGEETGTLDRQLEVAAEFYSKELTFKLERLTALFEPLVIIVMGAVVGFVAVALVSAMYGVYSSSNVGT